MEQEATLEDVVEAFTEVVAKLVKRIEALEQKLEGKE